MATNYKPVTGFGTIGEGSLQTKKQAQKDAVKRINQKRKRKASAYENSKKDVVYGTPGQGFQVKKGKEYPTLKNGKKATVDSMSITWIKDNMKKKPLTKKATGGTNNKISRVKPEPVKAIPFFDEKSYKEHPIASRVIEGTVMGALIAAKAGSEAVGAVKHVAKKAKKLGVKTSNFVKDTMKRVEKAKTSGAPIKKTKPVDVKKVATKVATKSYKAVKDYVPSTAKKVSKK